MRRRWPTNENFASIDESHSLIGELSATASLIGPPIQNACPDVPAVVGTKTLSQPGQLYGPMKALMPLWLVRGFELLAGTV